jgi:hypothetical protein
MTMAPPHRYFQDLRALLQAMPPGEIDMDRIELNEHRHGHRFADPAEIVERWLIDEQRRVQSV